MGQSPRPMTSDSSPDWETYPNLDGVITKADVSVKGSGKFSAAYVNHMKVSQLLRQHAPGWQFELLTTTDDDNRETVVFRAPDGTGMLRGFFRAPTGSGFMDTPPMPQAIMDHRNSPIKWDEIDARDITDTERRCMCIVAARHFGLAYELWAKDPVEDPHREAHPSFSNSSPRQRPKQHLQNKSLFRLRSSNPLLLLRLIPLLKVRPTAPQPCVTSIKATRTSLLIPLLLRSGPRLSKLVGMARSLQINPPFKISPLKSN